MTTAPARVSTDDGVSVFRVGTNCNPTEIRTNRDASLSRELAREIDAAVNRVAARPVAAQPVPLAAAAQTPLLYEGSPFSAFTATDIERYCAASWETRTAADGRTEYNPCKRRDAFR